MRNCIAIICLTSLLIFSCGKEKTVDPVDPANPSSSVETGTLAIKVVPMFGNQVMEMNKAIKDANGLDALKLEGKFHFYLSNVKLLVGTNPTVVEDDVLLIDLLDADLYQAKTKVEEGTYTGIEVGLGVDETKNHADPSTFANEHPLGFDHSGNNWAWEPGYIFYIVEGSFSTNGDGNLDNTFSYHIGTDAVYKCIYLDKDINIKVGEETTIELKIDMKKLLLDEEGMDLATENKSRCMGDQFPACEKFVDRLIEIIE